MTRNRHEGDNVHNLDDIREMRNRRDRDGRVVLDYDEGEIGRLVRAVQPALARLNMYRREHKLVHILYEPAPAAAKDGEERVTEKPVIRAVDRDWLQSNMTDCVTFRRLGQHNSFRVIDPPLTIISGLLSNATTSIFPVLKGILHTPTMRPDGTILDKPGYDKATGFALISNIKLGKVGETKVEAKAALGRLNALLDEFPFTSDASRASALSGLMTPVVRGAFPLAPIHCVRAPSSGSGKSYLCDLVSYISAGVPMPVIVKTGKNNDELDKRVGAAMIQGSPLICIDNLNESDGFNSNTFAAAVTQHTVEIRKFGSNTEVRTVDVTGLTFFMNGNNLNFMQDMTRRHIKVGLDPNDENPARRVFKSKPDELIQKNRAQYITDILTICRAYVACGSPNALGDNAFDGWSRLVRSSLIWLGCDDPIDTQITDEVVDPVNELRAAMFEAIWEQETLRNRFTARDLVKAYATDTPLEECLNQICLTGRSGKLDAAALGRWLANASDNMVNGLKLVAHPSKTNVATWRVMMTEAEKARRDAARAAKDARERD